MKRSSLSKLLLAQCSFTKRECLMRRHSEFQSYSKERAEQFVVWNSFLCHHM